MYYSLQADQLALCQGQVKHGFGQVKIMKEFV
jgi:hypothetical protein